jgi:PAS domain S-box-containing protein
MTQPVDLRLVQGTEPVLLGEPPRAWATGHDVQFYDTEDFLYASVASFLADGIRAGQPIVVIATDVHRKHFTDYLRATGVDVSVLLEGRDAIWLDANETLSAFMEGPMPDRELFYATVGNVFERVIKDRKYVVARAYGEMVDVLFKQGNIEGAIALEELWNELAAKYSFSLLCAYSMGNFFKEAHTHSFRRICGTHRNVLPTEEILATGESDRLRQITMLQQRARALEAEIRHREEVEAALRDMLEHRRRVEDSLRRSEAEMRDFLENASEGMHWVDAQGIILWANRAELEMLGYARAAYVGRHISEFYHDKDTCEEVLRRLARNEVLHEFEATLVGADGSMHHVLINSNVYWEDEKFVHTRCFTRDITKLKQSMS